MEMNKITDKIPFGKHKGKRFVDTLWIIPYYIKNNIVTFSKLFMEEYSKEKERELKRLQTEREWDYENSLVEQQQSNNYSRQTGYPGMMRDCWEDIKDSLY